MIVINRPGMNTQSHFGRRRCWHIFSSLMNFSSIAGMVSGEDVRRSVAASIRALLERLSLVKFPASGAPMVQSRNALSRSMGG